MLEPGTKDILRHALLVMLFTQLLIGCTNVAVEPTGNKRNVDTATVSATRVDSANSWTHFIQGYDNTRIIIFVHGFTGKYSETWGRFPELIVDDEDLDHYDVLLWGYPTKVFGRNPSISRIGATLRTEIDHLDKRYKEVVIAAHSMGGLVARSFVVDALIEGRGKDLTKIKKIVFFGVPNDGIDKAHLVPRFVNEQISDMRLASEFVVRLRREWINRVYRPLRADDYHKSIPSVAVVGLSDQFVTEESVRAFFEEYETTRGDHSEMVKPDSQNHLSYKIMKTQLLKDPDKVFGRDSVEYKQDSRAELIAVLSRRADDINRELLNPIGEDPLYMDVGERRDWSGCDLAKVSTYLGEFNRLHEQNVAALEAGHLIESHELRREVWNLLASIKERLPGCPIELDEEGYI